MTPVIVMTSAAGLAQQASDCAVISRLAGSWTGRGTLQRTAGADPEPVRCRLSFDWRPASGVLSSTMECRGIDLDFKLWGSISVVAPGGKLKGAFFGSEGVTDVAANGQCRPSALVLRLTENKPKAGMPVSSDLTITLSGNGSTLTNLLETREPDTGRKWQTISISFKR